MKSDLKPAKITENWQTDRSEWLEVSGSRLSESRIEVCNNHPELRQTVGI